jgi:hypothetical protein
MNRLFVGAMALALGAIPVAAQSLDDLNIQIHGYATQGFLYTTNNNAFTTKSSDGSPAWTEAVVNLTTQPQPKLRVGVQARYFLLGNFGNTITLDWASADYKVNEKFGVRFGKVKIPSNLFNETQDIDPSYLWALLPQSIYPLTGRNSLLAQYGGVIYGTFKLGPNMGKLDYRGWGGEQVIGADDGYWVALREGGSALPNGLSGRCVGAALHWKTPLSGLMVGASDIKKPDWSSKLTKGSTVGTMDVRGFNNWATFAIYEKNKIMIAGEYGRLYPHITMNFPGQAILLPRNKKQLYGMASYKITDKLTSGVYYSQQINKALPLAAGASRYSKDWAVSGRYDFNQYLYAKAEQHFIRGTDIIYDADLNPNGFKPNTKLTILKVGVSF